MIPLGLYRTVKVNLKAYKDQIPQKKVKEEDDPAASEQDFFKKIKYVVTNPDKDTRIEDEDIVFVLARSDPGDPEKWDDYDQNNTDVVD